MGRIGPSTLSWYCFWLLLVAPPFAHCGALSSWAARQQFRSGTVRWCPCWSHQLGNLRSRCLESGSLWSSDGGCAAAAETVVLLLLLLLLQFISVASAVPGAGAEVLALVLRSRLHV